MIPTPIASICKELHLTLVVGTTTLDVGAMCWGMFCSWSNYCKLIVVHITCWKLLTTMWFSNDTKAKDKKEGGTRKRMWHL
jgi:hypothetical protein